MSYYITGASRKRQHVDTAADVSSNKKVPQSFVSRMSNMTQNAPTLSDFTIVCGNRSWEVHRVILHLHSSVLGKACGGTFQEAHTATIDLSEDPEIAVEAMVEYMYNFDYDVCFSLSKTPTLSAHVEVAIIADKYDIPNLHRLASEMPDCCLKDHSVDNEELAEAAELAYDAPGPTAEIRGYIAQAAFRKPDVFFTKQAEDSPFSKLMDKQPMLSKDVALAAVVSDLIPRQQSPIYLTCPHCNEGMIKTIPAGSVTHCVQCDRTFWA